MAADKRAARLGVLALVATLLFGAVGARLWFLQTVQADSLQRTVDARKTKVIRLVPERGRIFDADGRILADNTRVLTVAVEWDVVRDDTDRAEMFTRLSGWLQMPVDEMEARYDSNTYSRYRPLPLKEDVEEPIAIALEERVEDFPGVTIVTEWRRTYPYAPLASHVIGYMGAITAEDEQRYQDKGYDTSVGGEDVGRAGVELSMENALHGRWGEEVVEVDANNRVVRTISYQPPGERQRRPALDRPRHPAVRRAPAADATPAPAPRDRPQPDRRAPRRHREARSIRPRRPGWPTRRRRAR